jgi:hypothetical protein
LDLDLDFGLGKVLQIGCFSSLSLKNPFLDSVLKLLSGVFLWRPEEEIERGKAFGGD